MVGVSLSVNIKKSDKNTDINKIDDVLLSHQIDAFAFEHSIKSNTSGTDELYFNLVLRCQYRLIWILLRFLRCHLPFELIRYRWETNWQPI